MEDNQYYHGLDARKLADEDSWLIVPFEAAWYYKTHKKDIRYSLLREKCSERLSFFTNGKRDDFGGNFEKIIKNCEQYKWLQRDKVGKKDTRFHPNMRLIEEYVKQERIENLASNDSSRIVGLISESLRRETSKARAPPIESVKVSGTVTRVVTHANQRKERKRKQKVPNDLIEWYQSIKKQ
jgi:hypothetical protein